MRLRSDPANASQTRAACPAGCPSPRQLDSDRKDGEGEHDSREFKGNIVERRTSPAPGVDQVRTMGPKDDSKTCCDDGFSCVESLLDEGTEERWL